MEGVIRGCCAGNKERSMYYMLQKWTDFGADWKRRPSNDQIPPEMSESIYFVRGLTVSRSLSGPSLTGILVYTERSAEKIRTVDDSPDPALYNSESFRDPHKTHVAKGLALV